MVDDKQQIVKNIQQSFYKHRGDIVSVAAELKYPLPYVSSVCAKIVRKLQLGIETNLPKILVEKILLGYTHRVASLNKDLDGLSSRRNSLLSECCAANVKTIVGNSITYVCTECKCRCNVVALSEAAVLSIKGKIIDRLRKEDELLVDLIEKTGVRFDSSITVTKTEEISVKANSGIELDPSITKNFTMLNPMDREKIRKQLLKKIEGGTEETRKPQTKKVLSESR